jgi:hypothetical protein
VRALFKPQNGETRHDHHHFHLKGVMKRRSRMAEGERLARLRSGHQGCLSEVDCGAFLQPCTPIGVRRRTRIVSGVQKSVEGCHLSMTSLADHSSSKTLLLCNRPHQHRHKGTQCVSGSFLEALNLQYCHRDLMKAIFESTYIAPITLGGIRSSVVFRRSQNCLKQNDCPIV